MTCILLFRAIGGERDVLRKQRQVKVFQAKRRRCRWFGLERGNDLGPGVSPAGAAELPEVFGKQVREPGRILPDLPGEERLFKLL